MELPRVGSRFSVRFARPPSIRNPAERLASHLRLGGLHRRYSWEKAA